MSELRPTEALHISDPRYTSSPSPYLVMATTFKPLNIAIIGGGLGGLSAAISLRLSGHKVTIYERNTFAGEVGAGIGIPPNGGKWLYKWGVDVDAALPVVLKKLIIHKWDTGEVIATAPLGDFKEKFGYETLGFQRCDLHQVLLEAALREKGEGVPCKLVTQQKAIEADGLGKVTFEGGIVVEADLVIGADGIHSRMRGAIGIVPDTKQASSCVYRHIISRDKARSLVLGELGLSDAIEFWTTPKTDRFIIGAGHGGEVLCMYSFFPIDPERQEGDGWYTEATPEQLVATFPTIDPRIHQLMLNSEDIKIWRLYIHEPYPYWTRGRVALLGDAAHPMLPDQTQGHCQAIEDAAALGLVFSDKYFQVNEAQPLEAAIGKALQRYEKVRMKRATALQAASAKAREDLRERIGWAVEERPGKMTIEDISGYDMESHLAKIVAQETEAL
ncbi:salicylate hydroxylase [Xylariales sp. PMI_506]|nr:salicylate hydroxylase [Xylariales sp. PMI_506]